MFLSLSLSLVVIALLAFLVIAAIRHRNRQYGLLRQRQVEHELRGAEHIKKVALAMHRCTGRNDIALALLQLARQQLEAAHRLAPQHQLVGASVRDYENLCNALRQGTIIAEPEVIPLDSAGLLNDARMQLLEALRLLGRVERQGWVEAGNLREMQDSLNQAQRSVEMRLNMRQATQNPAPPAEDEQPVHAPSS